MSRPAKKVRQDLNVDLEQGYQDAPAQPSMGGNTQSLFGASRRDRTPERERLSVRERSPERVTTVFAPTAATEVECSPAKWFCGVGTCLAGAGAALFWSAFHLGREGFKDVAKTDIVCCEEAIGATACVCGTCVFCIGYGIAYWNAKKSSP